MFLLILWNGTPCRWDLKMHLTAAFSRMQKWTKILDLNCSFFWEVLCRSKVSVGFKNQYYLQTYYLFQLDEFTAQCDIITSAVRRHKSRYFSNGLESNVQQSNNILRNSLIKGTLTNVELIMNNRRGCHKYPTENMDEHCKYFQNYTLPCKNF